MNTINKINNLLTKKKLSKLANKRVARDLEAVFQRLKKSEYETSSIVKNIFDMAEQSRVFYAHLNTYARIGRTWGEVFKFLSIGKYGEILDICPGFAPKIEIGLFYCGYKGRITILDKNKEAISSLKKIMFLFRPEFDIVPYVRDLFSPIPIRKSFQIVAGNHILDDMILAYFCKLNKITDESIYEKEDEFIKLWNMILDKDFKFVGQLVSELSNIFASLTDKNGYLCLAQYKSYMEKMLSLNRSYLFTKKVFKKIIQNLCANGFKRIELEQGLSNLKNHYFDNESIVILKRMK